MKPQIRYTFMLLLNSIPLLLIAQDGREVFSNGYQSGIYHFDRFENGAWVLGSIDSPVPGALYSDTLSVYFTDSIGNVIRSIPLTPPRNFEVFAFEKILALPDGAFVAVYSGGDCDAGGYAYYMEKRDTLGQLKWQIELPEFYYPICYGYSQDSHILLVTSDIVTKLSTTNGSIIWEADHTDTYSYNIIIVPGTEDLILFDKFGLKYFRQDTASDEIIYLLQEFTEITPLNSNVTSLTTDGKGTFYALKYPEKQLFRFNQDLQVEVMATLVNYPRDMASSPAGIMYLHVENYNTTNLISIDSMGHESVVFQFKDTGIRPQKLYTYQDGIALVGSYGSGPPHQYIPEFRFTSRAQGWFKNFPSYNFVDTADGPDIAVTQIIRQDSIHIEKFWSQGPTPTFLYDFTGGDFKVEITNHGHTPVTSFSINITFGENINVWFCGPTSAKQLFIPKLEILPGETVWVEFGDIGAYNQFFVPDQFCFWTSGPDFFPDQNPENDTYCIDRIVAVSEINDAGLTIFPNPVNDILFLQWNETGSSPKYWTIYDLHGRIIKRGQWNGSIGSESVEMIDVPSGIYALACGSLTRKIVVQH